MAELGRRARLRIWCPYGRGGSSPPSRTLRTESRIFGGAATPSSRRQRRVSLCLNVQENRSGPILASWSPNTSASSRAKGGPRVAGLLSLRVPTRSLAPHRHGSKRAVMAAWWDYLMRVASLCRFG